MPQDTELEKRLEDQALRSLDPLPPSQQHPGASLLSPQALSPEPFGSFAIDAEIASQRPMSPILDVSNGLLSKFHRQRPLSAQGFGFLERPLSSIELDSLTFKTDVGTLVGWVSGLNGHQQRTVVDNILTVLPDDVLHYMGQQLQDQDRQLFHHGQEPVALDSVLWDQSLHPHHQPHQTHHLPLPQKQQVHYPGSFLQQPDPTSARPRSADACEQDSLNLGMNALNLGTISRPQLAQPQPRGDAASLASRLQADYQSGLKLSALSTINSRTQLESSRKERGRSGVFGDEYTRNSSSVPPPPRVSHYDVLNAQRATPVKSPVQATPKSPAVNAKQLTSPRLLNDVPAWLKTLRLHKYTPALEGVPWQELIYYTDEQLAERGVGALGARGKLLKAFEVVREHYEEGLII